MTNRSSTFVAMNTIIAAGTSEAIGINVTKRCWGNAVSVGVWQCRQTKRLAQDQSPDNIHMWTQIEISKLRIGTLSMGIGAVLVACVIAACSFIRSSLLMT
jgi:hypothetical protein